MHIWYCVAAVIAGTLIPLQAGLNAQLRFRLESPFYATLVSITVSLAAIGLYCLIARPALPTLAQAGQSPWWVWTGGLVGVIYIFMVLLLAPNLGATALIASIIGGQMLCSLLLDQFGLIGFAQHPINLGRAAGIVLLFAGVALIQKY